MNILRGLLLLAVNIRLVGINGDIIVCVYYEDYCRVIWRCWGRGGVEIDGDGDVGGEEELK